MQEKSKKEVVNFIKYSNNFYSTHYPERLFKIIIINAPMSFRAIWNMIKGFIDPVTKKKVIMVSKKNVYKTLLEYIDDENIPPCYKGSSVPLGQSPEDLLQNQLFSELNSR